jgi:hypothetical protein
MDKHQHIFEWNEDRKTNVCTQCGMTSLEAMEKAGYGCALPGDTKVIHGGPVFNIDEINQRPYIDLSDQYSGVFVGPAKPRTWWQKRKASWQELYYATKDTYYVCRWKTEPIPGSDVKTITETMYLNPAEKMWHSNRRYATILGFKTAVLCLLLMKLQYRKTEYEFILSPAAEIAFIDEVTNGPAVRRNDFR